MSLSTREMNPYASPTAVVEDPSDELFSLPLATIGMLIATGAAYVLGIFYGNAVQWFLLNRGVPVNDLYNTVAGSPWFNVGGHLINVFAAALGGYWAATFRPKRAPAHAAAAGALMLVPVAIAWITPYDIPHPPWSIVLTFITPVPSALIGAWWWRRRTWKQQT